MSRERKKVSQKAVDQKLHVLVLVCLLFFDENKSEENTPYAKLKKDKMGNWVDSVLIIIRTD